MRCNSRPVRRLRDCGRLWRMRRPGMTVMQGSCQRICTYVVVGGGLEQQFLRMRWQVGPDLESGPSEKSCDLYVVHPYLQLQKGTRTPRRFSIA